MFLPRINLVHRMKPSLITSPSVTPTLGSEYRIKTPKPDPFVYGYVLGFLTGIVVMYPLVLKRSNIDHV